MEQEASILEVLERQGREMSLAELLGALEKKGISDQPRTKATLWSLISRVKVELTPDRTLRLGRSRRSGTPSPR
jgi:hypothetical protein